MAEQTEIELLITVVVSADADHAARDACHDLVHQLGGRIVESADCSDEEPGCWSVTISRDERTTGAGNASAVLARTVRGVLRELGGEYAKHRVACEPPTAWTVVDNPELVGTLVTGGERLLAEAWVGGSELVVGGLTPEDPDEPMPPPAVQLDDRDENGLFRPRLELSVDVVTERRAGAEWPARALASRVSPYAAITDCREQPPMVRVIMDLGPARGTPADIVRNAVSALGGHGWSRLRVQDETATARWSAAPTPPSGIAAVRLSAAEPTGVP